MFSKPYTLTGLPYQAINSLLTTPLESDNVYVSFLSIQHIKENHLPDSTVALQLLPELITQPEYVGFTLRHPQNFSLFKRYQERVLLAAISLIINDYGKYPLQSCYFIDEDALQHRIRKGFVVQIIKGHSEERPL
jgi:hypothetical protein